MRLAASRRVWYILKLNGREMRRALAGRSDSAEMQEEEYRLDGGCAEERTQ
jgi:hypothetical protein